MAGFRFRAQVALDLRRKQDDEAQRALGVARQATVAAQRALDEQVRILEESHARARIEEAHASDTSRAVWYRNWMTRQRLVIAAARAAVDARRNEETAAAQRTIETRRRLRSLERWRDRHEKAFQLAERRAEQKEFDVLGGLRYVARRVVPEGA